VLFIVVSRARSWYSHERAKWPEFAKRYCEELSAAAEGVASLARFVQEKERAGVPVTFVFRGREREHNSAAVLKAYLEKGAAAAGDVVTSEVPLEHAREVGTPVQREREAAAAAVAAAGEESEEGVEEPEE
jgi:hypothetical protein